MRTISFLAIFFTLSTLSFSQSQTTEFKEGHTVTIEGVDFYYTLGPEEVRNVDGGQYSFYNIEWMISNKGKFSKVFLLDKDKLVENPEFDMTKRAYLGKLYIVNGMQSSSTKKFDFISAEPNTQIITYSKRILINKRNFNDGYNLQAGQTLNSSFTVAVTKGQKPAVVLYPLLSKCY